MPTDYSYDPETGILTMWGSGEVTMEERFDCVRRLLKDQTLPKTLPILLNATKVTSKPKHSDLAAVEMLVKLIQVNHNSPIAILNSETGEATLTHVVAFMTNGPGLPVKAFLDQTEAMNWLRQFMEKP